MCKAYDVREARSPRTTVVRQIISDPRVRAVCNVKCKHSVGCQTIFGCTAVHHEQPPVVVRLKHGACTRNGAADKRTKTTRHVRTDQLQHRDRQTDRQTDRDRDRDLLIKSQMIQEPPSTPYGHSPTCPARGAGASPANATDRHVISRGESVHSAIHRSSVYPASANRTPSSRFLNGHTHMQAKLCQRVRVSVCLCVRVCLCVSVSLPHCINNAMHAHSL